MKYHDRWEIELFSNNLQIHKHKAIDIDDVITEFTRIKGRHLALCL